MFFYGFGAQYSLVRVLGVAVSQHDNHAGCAASQDVNFSSAAAAATEKSAAAVRSPVFSKQVVVEGGATAPPGNFQLRF